MKKAFTFFFLSIFVFLKIHAEYSGICGTNVQWTLSNTGTLTISGTGSMYDYYYESNVPWHQYRSSINTIVVHSGVTSIGDNAFYDSDNLTSITLPNTILAIGEWALADCSMLSSLSIPSSVTAIYGDAFSGSGLKNVSIPNSVIYLSSSSFAYCHNLESATIGSGITNFYSEVFIGCENLKEIQINEANTSYTSIDGVIYTKDKQTCILCPEGRTKSVVLPENLTTINSAAFKNCKNIKFVSIPSTVTKLGTYVFQGCTGLKMINCKVKDPITIGNGVFYGVDVQSAILSVPESSVESYSGSLNWNTFSQILGVDECGSCDSDLMWYVKMNGEMHILGEGMMDDFYYEDDAPWYSVRDKIKNLIINEGVTIIGENGFYQCNNLETVSLPTTITSINRYAFSGCSNLKDINLPNNLVTIGKYAFAGCIKITKIEIPNSISEIGKHAFIGCENLEECNFGSSFATFYYTSFQGCKNLKTININGNNSHFKSINNIIYSYDGSKLVFCPEGKTGNLEIPSEVKSIDAYAFYGCTNLEGVTVPATVNVLSQYAFYGCNGLKKITIYKETPYAIGNGMFYGVDKQNCILCVPYSSISLYKSATEWSTFINIKGINIESTDISNLEYAIYCNETTINAGRQLTLPIFMKNSKEVTLWQTDIEFPKGITIAVDDWGDPIVNISGSRTSTTRHSIAATTLSDGTVRLLCSSTSNKVFTGTDGEVATIVLDVDNDLEAGDIPIIFKNILISEPNETNHEEENIVVKCTLKQYTLGDVNNDGYINGADLVCIVNYIMEKPNENNIKAAADINKDGNINGADYVAEVNAILGITQLANVKSIVNSPEQNNYDNILLTSEYDEDSQKCILNGKFDSQNDYVLAQFDVKLQDGLDLIENITEDINHSLYVNKLSNGNYRLLLASSSNKLFSSIDNLFSLHFASNNSLINYEVLISNILLVKSNGEAVNIDNMKTSLTFDNANSINNLKIFTNNKNVFNINGSKTKEISPSNKVSESLHKGIYVINGKKVFIK